MPCEVEEAGGVFGVDAWGYLEFFEFGRVVLFHLHQVVEIVAFSSIYYQWHTRFSCSAKILLFRQCTLG